jgi:GPI-anchor transamidase subunit GAA1
MFSIIFRLKLVPLYRFHLYKERLTKLQYFTLATHTFATVDIILPLLLAVILTHGPISPPTSQQYLLMKSFSLLLLGIFLSALATLNFSLSFMVGLLCAPLSFIGCMEKSTALITRMTVSIVGLLVMNLLSPMAVFIVTCWYTGVPVSAVLTEAAFGWDVWSMWTQVVVWCVWWPAWLSGCVLLGSSLF